RLSEDGSIAGVWDEVMGHTPYAMRHASAASRGRWRMANVAWRMDRLVLSPEGLRLIFGYARPHRNRLPPTPHRQSAAVALLAHDPTLPRDRHLYGKGVRCRRAASAARRSLLVSGVRVRVGLRLAQ